MSAYIPVTAHQPTQLSNFACIHAYHEQSKTNEVYPTVPIVPSAVKHANITKLSACFVINSIVCGNRYSSSSCNLVSCVNYCTSLPRAIDVSAVQDHAGMSLLLAENGCLEAHQRSAHTKMTAQDTEMT